MEWATRNSRYENSLYIYNLSDGKLVNNINLIMYHTRTRIAQIRNGRVALMGQEHCVPGTKIIIFNLWSGEKIFSVGYEQDLQIYSKFVLQTERLLFSSKEGFVSMNFWK